MSDETPLSARARQFRAQVEDPARFPETCEGDVGSAKAPAVWLFGLEPGWSTQQQREEASGSGASDADCADYSVGMQLRWPFNRNAFKLLAALKGEAPQDYRAFAQRLRPFERDSKGYLKSNLFPVACNKLGEWDEDHRDETGFSGKSGYQTWVRQTRLAVVRAWIEACRPKLLICTGLGHIGDFLALTDTKEIPAPHVFQVNGHLKRVHVASTGAVPVAVIPHLSGGPHSLNSAQAISETAAHIRRTLPHVAF